MKELGLKSFRTDPDFSSVADHIEACEFSLL